MNNKYIPIALLLLGVGLSINNNLELTNPLDWFYKGSITVCIFEETLNRSSLPDSQISLMNSISFSKAIENSGGVFLGCFDKDIVDRDKKPPEELIPYLEAVKKLNQLPALVFKRGNRVTAIPLPLSEKTAMERVK